MQRLGEQVSSSVSLPAVSDAAWLAAQCGGGWLARGGGGEARNACLLCTQMEGAAETSWGSVVCL